MNEIKLVGTQEFMDKEIKVLEGGFHKNARIITVKQISEIHNVEVKEVNKLINNNIDEFEKDIDIIDLKETGDYKELVLSLGYSNAEYGNAKHIYILSEQGYIALVSLMKTDKAKEIRKKFRREYFAMCEVIKSDEQLLANLCLQLYKGGQDAVIASQKITEIEVKKATKPLLETIETKDKTIKSQQDDIQIKKDIITGFTEDIDIYTKKDIVNRVIKKCVNGNYQQRYNEMYKCFKETYHIDLKARCDGYNMKQIKKKDKLSTIKYAEMFGHIEGLYEVASKLYATEVKQLLKELGKIVEL